MKLYFMLAYCRNSPAPNAVLVDLIELLRSDGFEVELGVAQDLVLEPDRMAVTHDLYILKSHAELWLSLAGVLHNKGARLLNPYLSCVAANNKIVGAERLRAANIPTPRSWVTGDLNQLRSFVEQQPLLIKPCIGGRGKHIYVVRDPDELARLPQIHRPWLVQEYVLGPGLDLKLYVIGEQVFGVRKPFSTTSFAVPGEPCQVSPEVRAIALRCGRIFGLELYGLDVIESPSGPVVVDVNFFPSYKGVPYAAEILAAHIGKCARAKPAVVVQGNWGARPSALRAGAGARRG